MRPSSLPLAPARIAVLARRGARLLALTTPPVRAVGEQPAAARELAERAVDDRTDVLGSGAAGLDGHGLMVRIARAEEESR